MCENSKLLFYHTTFLVEFHDPLSSNTMKFHFANDLFTAHIQKTPFIQEQTRQMVEFTLLCDMTTFCTSHSSCVCASTFTVASYILILNSKRKLVTEMPLKQKMRIHSCLFHIFQHLTLKMNQNIKISIMNLFVSNTSVLHSTKIPFDKFYFRMLILGIK